MGIHNRIANSKTRYRWYTTQTLSQTIAPLIIYLFHQPLCLTTTHSVFSISRTDFLCLRGLCLRQFCRICNEPPCNRRNNWVYRDHILCLENSRCCFYQNGNSHCTTTPTVACLRMQDRSLWHTFCYNRYSATLSGTSTPRTHRRNPEPGISSTCCHQSRQKSRNGRISWLGNHTSRHWHYRYCTRRLHRKPLRLPRAFYCNWINIRYLFTTLPIYSEVITNSLQHHLTNYISLCIIYILFNHLLLSNQRAKLYNLRAL